MADRAARRPLGQTSPTRAEMADAIGAAPVVPVTRRLLADGETPVGLYRKLAHDRPGTFLLESAEQGRSWSRYSFVGVRASATLTERGGEAHWIGTPPPGADQGYDPLEVLRASARLLRSPRTAGLPPLTGGFVGLLSYDIVRRLERLPDLNSDDLRVPEVAMMLATDLAVLDHLDGTVLLVANVLTRPDLDGDAAYEDAEQRLDAMTADLSRPSPPSAAAVDLDAEPAARTIAPDGWSYADVVERGKEEIRAGEVFQVVLSQRFAHQARSGALEIYRVLRMTNPSPYMYLLRFDGFDVVGSSPEPLVKIEGDRALVRPIAGSRRRGATPAEDADLAAELLADIKERAEHLMLVDLARNDLGRVCRAGSVEVVDFMTVERFSHVMHIVSTVVGTIADDREPLDVLTACFPAGTLSGAPKPRAMELIEELEPSRRGLYGGTIGYVGFHGDLDAAIAIRTALVRDGVAYVQAGAGIVADSDPAAEDAECRAKAAAVLRAVAAAETLRPPTETPQPPTAESPA